MTYIFKPEEDEVKRYFKDTAQVTEEIIELYDDLLAPEAVEHYFDIYYHQQKDRWDKKKILDAFQLINSRGFPLNFQFKEVRHKF